MTKLFDSTYCVLITSYPRPFIENAFGAGDSLIHNNCPPFLVRAPAQCTFLNCELFRHPHKFIYSIQYSCQSRNAFYWKSVLQAVECINEICGSP